MKRNSICLSGAWELVWTENRRVRNENIRICTLEQFSALQERRIDAVVPGNFELDLLRNGLIEDPFFGTNPTQLRQYEYVHMWYGRAFAFDGETEGAELVFDGIDTVAEIYLNGALIGETDNMLIPHRLPAAALKKGRNELVVHILPATLTARERPSYPSDFALHYCYAGQQLRKAAHSFGWDIMPRAVSGGLWRDVRLEEAAAGDRIEDTYLYTLRVQGEGETACLELFYRMHLEEDDIFRYAVEIEGVCGDSRFFAKNKLWFTSGKLRFDVRDAHLWWIAGQGDANLYQVQVRLLRDGQCVDTKEFRHGIRTVELVRTSVIDEQGNGDFHIRLNGRRVFIKGTNWVPADAFHSRDKERIPDILKMVTDIGCNAVRCWGGNVYEDDPFFDYCDEHGLLVWQDFAFACAVYPRDDAFLRAVEAEVRTIVKKLRQHPSLAIWAGDNEVDQSTYDYGYYTPPRNPNEDRRSRQVIPNVLLAEDPLRPYLPSSPFVDEEAIRHGLDKLTENHLWGPRDYFKSDFYQNSVACFASEMGYHGCTAPKSMEKFLSKDCLWPANNAEWMMHCAPPDSEDGSFAYRRGLMFHQVEVLFGSIPDNLEEFALASQISQAEAMKFFIEMFRSQKWRRTGIIWWNIMDGWPQFSDAVVDYYFAKKLAYHYIRTSQLPLCLMFKEPKDGRQQLVAANDTQQDIAVSYTVTDLQSGQVVLSGNHIATADSSVTLDTLGAPDTQGVYLIEWQAGKYSGKNHYLYGKGPFNFSDYIHWMKKTDLLCADGFYSI